uniref:Uncharacterized protein n=1 Tax=Medicago truncatula TaxID=3880 RepID=Q2HTI1_MEDTR|nr:hypothetical protein MtrDRAFT_AC150441g8v1 [Medicago truncatula]
MHCTIAWAGAPKKSETCWSFIHGPISAAVAHTYLLGTYA